MRVARPKPVIEASTTEPLQNATSHPTPIVNDEAFAAGMRTTTGGSESVLHRPSC